MVAAMEKFLAMWCNEGLECLINLSAREKENIVAVLRGESVPHRNPIQHMILRARFNTQRHYEIYVFESEIDEVSIREFFDASPQVIVDAIRNCGTVIHSDRATETDRIRIT